MTAVAQVAAVVDMDEVTNEDEHNEGHVENDDDIAQEDDVGEETPCVSDEAKTGKMQTKRVRRKENEEGKGSKAINGVAQNAKANTEEDQNISDLALKKEVSDACKIMDSRVLHR